MILSGTGQAFAASANTSSATVAAGQTASYMLSLASQGGFSGAVSLTCTGAPSAATCSVTPGSVSLAASASTPITVSVTTTARSLVSANRLSTPTRSDWVNVVAARLADRALGACLEAYRRCAATEDTLVGATRSRAVLHHTLDGVRRRRGNTWVASDDGNAGRNLHARRHCDRLRVDEPSAPNARRELTGGSSNRLRPPKREFVHVFLSGWPTPHAGSVLAGQAPAHSGDIKGGPLDSRRLVA